MMARWLPQMVLMLVIRTTNLESDDACQTHLSVFKWPQLTCSNVTSEYFQNFDVPLNRTHWIKCIDCCLTVIDERTFHFTRNNISFLELQESKILSLKQYAFSSLFLLKLLNLRGNKIEYLEPKCFSGLKRLFQLDLSSNCLIIVTNNIFSDLENLNVLNLNKNQIFLIQPYAFAGLKNLKYLYLNNNQLKKLEDKMFEYLTNLRILYMEHNQIEEIHQNAFSNLTNLSFLYLNNNSISFLVQYNFKPLTSLIDLQLRYNNLSEIQVSSFNGLKNLRYLYLGENRISLVKPYGFIGLDSLVVLDLVRNNFTYVDFTYFDKIKNLYILWLNYNFISEFSINAKSEVQNSLAVLDLSYNLLGEYDFKLLYSRLPNIKEIVLTNNSFSCDFFTNMYSFFQTKNISVCMSLGCHFNETITYIENICSEEQVTSTTDDVLNSTDFSTDSSPTLDTIISFCLLHTTLILLLFIC